MSDEIIMLARGLEDAISSTNGIEASSEATGFEDDNLLDRKKSTLWKPGATGAASIWIDMGALVYVNSIVLVNNNAYSDSWTGIALAWESSWKGTDTWIFGSIGSEHPPVITNEPLWYEEVADPAVAARYWRLYIAGLTDSVSHIGTILLGLNFKPEPYLRPRSYVSVYGVDIEETRGGHRSSNLRHDERFIIDPANFAFSDTDKDNFMVRIWRVAKGSHYPIYFQDVDDEQYWIRLSLDGRQPYQEPVYGDWMFPLKIEEEF